MQQGNAKYLQAISKQHQERSPKRSLLHKILWVVGGGLGLLFLVNILLPDLDFSGEDRIALIRIEGVILDAQETLGELKKFSENPTVKAICFGSIARAEG